MKPLDSLEYLKTTLDGMDKRRRTSEPWWDFYMRSLIAEVEWWRAEHPIEAMRNAKSP